MSDIEFDILDELYFVTSFGQLALALDMDEKMLKNSLEGLLKKGWIECLISPEDETPVRPAHFEREYRNYYYLATKAGLLAHNSNL